MSSTGRRWSGSQCPGGWSGPGGQSMNRMLWPGLPSDSWGCWLSARLGEPSRMQRQWAGAPVAEPKHTWALSLRGLFTGGGAGSAWGAQKRPLGPGLTGRRLSFRMCLASFPRLFFSAAYACSRSSIPFGFWSAVGTAVSAGSSLKLTASICTNRYLTRRGPAQGEPCHIQRGAVLSWGPPLVPVEHRYRKGLRGSPREEQVAR